MRPLILLAIIVSSLFPPMPAFAQTDNTISLAAVHLNVRDPAVHRALWSDVFGAQAIRVGTLEYLKLPGMLIGITRSTPDGGSAGSALDHVSVTVKDIAAVRTKLAAARIELGSNMIAAFPDGVRVEVVEDKTIAAASSVNHVHIVTPDPDALRAWYVRTFGARFDIGKLNFLRSTAAVEPAEGRAIDRLGVEVRDLQAFVRSLQAAGARLTVPVHEMSGLRMAFIEDPDGTSIELTQGLAAR